MTGSSVAPARLVPIDGVVVHLTAEYWPFARTGGLAEAVRGLAEHQTRSGQKATIIMPLYRTVREYTDMLRPVTPPFTVAVADREEHGRVYLYTGKDIGPRVFFIEHVGYFDRPGIYNENGVDYPDNPRRFAFFCLAALRVLPRIVPNASVVHTHDWHTALANPYLRHTLAGDPFYDRLATVLSAHNAAYQGYFDPSIIPDVGLPWSVYDWRRMEWYGHANVLKVGLTFADMATTVSPAHAAELRTPEGGFGLHDHFIAMGDRFVGIINGIDYQIWDPSSDPHITARYSADDLTPKKRCKTALQRVYGFPRRLRTPVVAMSARLVEQKGFDLILAPGFLSRVDAQFIFIGRGDPHYETALSELARQTPDKVAVPLAFTERLEHRLLAGADILLMPSQFEPCGLTQMRAQRYGALPVARRVGGLLNTIEDGLTGFLFNEYRSEALELALQRAIEEYREQKAWLALANCAMQVDHSWGPSAARYQELYHRAAARRREYIAP